MRMDKNEGVRRMQLLAKRTMLFGALAGLSLWILNQVLHWAIHQGPSPPPMTEGSWGLAELYILVAFPLACGAMLWVIAWIVEGFMTTKSD